MRPVDPSRGWSRLSNWSPFTAWESDRRPHCRARYKTVCTRRLWAVIRCCLTARRRRCYMRGPTQINTIIPSVVYLHDFTHVQIVTPTGTIDGPTLALIPAVPDIFQNSATG